MSTFSDKSAMEEALASLHRYVKSMYISVDLPKIDETAIEEYFNTEDSKRQAQFDKMIGASAIQAIYADPEIPKRFKAKVARRASSELQDAFRGAKIEYEYAAGKYGAYGQQANRTYERKKKEIKLCRKAAWLDRLKRNLPRQLTKQAAKQSVKALLTAGGFSIGGPVGALIGFATSLAVDAIWFLVPRKQKETIKKKCGEIAQKACVVVKTIGVKIKSSPVVKKAVDIVEKYVAPLVKPIYEKSKELLSKAKEKIGNGIRRSWKALKSFF